MIKDGTRYLNLEEQVEWNKNHIEGFLAGVETVNNFGIKILGVVPSEEYIPKDLPYSYGDAYAVGEEPPYVYYVYTRSGIDAIDGTFVNIGVFPGKGEKGEPGTPGKDGENGKTPYIGANDHWWIGTTDTGVSAKGLQGARGPQGVQGEKGSAGGYKLYGELQSISSLPTPTKELQNDSAAYVVAGDLYMVMGVTAFEWYNLGKVGGTGLRGEPGIGIDTMTKLTAPYGESSVTYDTTDGMHIVGDARIDYGETSYKQVDTDISIPIKAGTGISMDATSDNSKVEVSLDTQIVDNIVENKLSPVNDKIDGKRDIVPPAPVGGLSRLYGVVSRSAANPDGKQIYFEASQSAVKAGIVIIRDNNGQINMPNQATYAPRDDQAISKRYADATYGEILKNTSTSVGVPVFKVGESTPYQFQALQSVVSDSTFGTRFNTYSVPLRQENGKLYDFYNNVREPLITKAEADDTYALKGATTGVAYQYTTTNGRLSDADVTDLVDKYTSGYRCQIKVVDDGIGHIANDTLFDVINVTPANGIYPANITCIASGIYAEGKDGSKVYQYNGYALLLYQEGGYVTKPYYAADGMMTRILFDGVPASATEGTITDEVTKQIIVQRDRSIIKFNKEIYYKADVGHAEGYITYTHTGYENNKFIHKAITINTNNWSWVLNTSE